MQSDECCSLNRRLKNKTIKVKIGEVIPYEKFKNDLSYTEWAQKIKEDIYKI